jgi:hypothetical protein
MILIDDLIKEDGCQQQVSVEVDGQLMNGYQIAKPLNYDPEYMDLTERWKMAKLIMEGKAIAVQYFTDLTKEQQVAYVKSKIEGEKQS